MGMRETVIGCHSEPSRSAGERMDAHGAHGGMMRRPWGHGRLEVRRVWASSSLDWLDPKHAWKGLRSIVMVERMRSVGEETSTERAYYVSSHAADAAELGGKIREHWSIENSLHWTLDVTFGEDRSRIRSRNAVQNFAALRKLALALLKRDTSMPKLSVARKRNRAARLDDYLLAVFCGDREAL
jgi:predicted transposase YbfD/YdcC